MKVLASALESSFITVSKPSREQSKCPLKYLLKMALWLYKLTVPKKINRYSKRGLLL